MQVIILTFVNNWCHGLDYHSAFPYQSKEDFEKYISDYLSEDCSILFIDSLDDTSHRNTILYVGSTSYDCNAIITKIK